MVKSNKDNVLVVGGGGYVGSVLVPKLLCLGYKVRVLDTFWYGEEVLSPVRNRPNLELVKGDIRDKSSNKKALNDIDVVIDLACISNDPSADLNPAFTHSINYDGQVLLMKMAKESKSVKRFIYASTSSVYGIKQEENVTEELPLEPLTQYSRLKAETEKVILGMNSDDFVCIVLRPATVCGYSPRMRLDLSVNLLASQAICNKKITVFGGTQKRPNINMNDVVNAYCLMIEAPEDKIFGEIFNVGYENMKIIDLANSVKKVIGDDVEIAITGTNDLRSYHISSQKIKKKLGFTAVHTIEAAVKEIKSAFAGGLIKDPNYDGYHNVKFMKSRKIDMGV